MATFAFEKLEAVLDNGNVQCGACGLYDDRSKMRLNADGSQFLCREAAMSATPCADERVRCAACQLPWARKDLDVDGKCGCELEAASERFENVLGAAGLQ